jgi:CheY-like chemotaxis protein
MSKLTATLLPVLLFAVPAAAQEAFIPWANKFFTGRGDTPPPVILQDFGTLPKGTVKTYRFKLTNIYAFPVQIREPKPSCGCLSVIEYSGKLEPRDTGHIDIKVDTSRVEGYKQVELPVRFDLRDPKTGENLWSTARLEIRVVSRPDIEIRPGVVQFGTVPAGKKATQAVDIVYSGRQPKWKITEVGYKKDLFDVTVNDLQMRGATGFQVTATLKATAPAGMIDEQIVLKTNDPVAPALTLMVTGEVQAPLSFRGLDNGVLRLTKVEVGKKVEMNVPVWSDKPFKVTKVEGQGDGVSVVIQPGDAKKAQVIIITFAPEKAGVVKKVLTVKTDTGDSATLTVEAFGIEPPQ